MNQTADRVRIESHITSRKKAAMHIEGEGYSGWGVVLEVHPPQPVARKVQLSPTRILARYPKEFLEPGLQVPL